MEPVVHLRGAVTLLGRFPALAGIDLDVTAGEIVLLRGPNGAGKTTLLRLCAGLLAVTRGEAHVLQGKDIPAGVALFAIHGPFLFGSTDKLVAIERRLPELPPVVILRLRNMPAIDGTGLGALEELAGRLHKSGRRLVLCDMREQPALLMGQADFARHVGEEDLCATFTDALARAREILAAGSTPRT